MPIHFKKISTLLDNQKNKIPVARLILDYAVIKQKLEKSDKASWYFKQAMNSNREKSKDLLEQFENIRKTINNSTIDHLISELNEENSMKKKLLQKRGLNTVDQIFYHSLLSRISYLNELIRIKKTMGQLNPIEYYINNPGEFLKLAGE